MVGFGCSEFVPTHNRRTAFFMDTCYGTIEETSPRDSQFQPLMLTY